MASDLGRTHVVDRIGAAGAALATASVGRDQRHMGDVPNAPFETLAAGEHRNVRLEYQAA